VINGGASRGYNLHPVCEWCEPPKTEADVHEKSRSYRLRHAGIKLAPKGRPLPGTFASGWRQSARSDHPPASSTIECADKLG
jgi:hypothetical protein